LDITNISLAQVTDDFLSCLEKGEEISPSELADFLVVAAKLLLIKSSLLLPGVSEPEFEELNLEEQLKIYREYYTASKLLNKILNKKNIALARSRPHLMIQPQTMAKIKIKPDVLTKVFQETINFFLKFQTLPRKTLRQAVSLQEKIKECLVVIKKRERTTFRQLSDRRPKIEVVVSFLAILELAQQRMVSLKQVVLFGEIIIQKL